MTDDGLFRYTDEDGDSLRVVPSVYGVESTRVVYFHNGHPNDAISVRLGEAQARELRDALSLFLEEDAPADPFAETVPDRIRPTVTEAGDRLRMTSLEIVSRMSVAGLRVEDIVESARAVEAYLRGVDGQEWGTDACSCGHDRYRHRSGSCFACDCTGFTASTEEPDETLTARRNLERTPMAETDERTGMWKCEQCGHFHLDNTHTCGYEDRCECRSVKPETIIQEIRENVRSATESLRSAPCMFCGHAGHGTVTCRTQVTRDTVTRACTCRGV